MSNYTLHKFPKSRISTIDVCEIGRKKHQVAAFVEFDVSLCRKKIKDYKRTTGRISFMAWLIKVISHTIQEHKNVAGFLAGKQKIMVFDDINISCIVEKEVNGEKVPMPVLLEKTNECTIEAITRYLKEAKEEKLKDKQAVIKKKSSILENLYYHLPGSIRRMIWKFLLKRPKISYPKMGNVVITSLGLAGQINGWFIPISVHPLCFGIGSIIKKPAVVNDKIEIREIINVSVLFDHDVIDGAPMARFIRALSMNIEQALFL